MQPNFSTFLARERLAGIVASLPPVTVAVSGGADSLTLATFIGRGLDDHPLHAIHAVSPHISAQATARVRATAKEEDWNLEIVDAVEFTGAGHLVHPADRCYCRSHLYHSLSARTDRLVLTGANTDDLAADPDRYQPGLQADGALSVRHPFVEAGLDKPGVRRLARALGLGHMSGFAAAPCQANPTTARIAIDPEALGFARAVENSIRLSALQPRTVHCRVHDDSLVIELDGESIDRLTPGAADSLRRRALEYMRQLPALMPIRFAPRRDRAA